MLTGAINLRLVDKVRLGDSGSEHGPSRSSRTQTEHQCPSRRRVHDAIAATDVHQSLPDDVMWMIVMYVYELPRKKMMLMVERNSCFGIFDTQTASLRSMSMLPLMFINDFCTVCMSCMQHYC